MLRHMSQQVWNVETCIPVHSACMVLHCDNTATRLNKQSGSNTAHISKALNSHPFTFQAQADPSRSFFSYSKNAASSGLFST